MGKITKSGSQIQDELNTHGCNPEIGVEQWIHTTNCPFCRHISVVAVVQSLSHL